MRKKRIRKGHQITVTQVLDVQDVLRLGVITPEKQKEHPAIKTFCKDEEDLVETLKTYTVSQMREEGKKRRIDIPQGVTWEEAVQIIVDAERFDRVVGYTQ